jgi:predicted nucleotidyltransferase/uncharacterized protein (UPF0332 family)
LERNFQKKSEKMKEEKSNEKKETKDEKEERHETKEQRMQEKNLFTKKVVEKYGKFVKAVVMMGSTAREEFKPKSDIDMFVILDDTAMKLTPEMQDKIDAELEKIAEKISPNLSVQPTYSLTEFWDFARVANPIIYNFIKEGVAVYDIGFFEPIKNLLNMGRIPATREAIENYMEGAPKKLMRAKTVKLLMLAEDAYYAMLNTAQAVLMFMGLPPPVPNKAYEEVKLNLVEPGILEPEYAEWLKEIIEIRKKIEHKEIMDVEGKFVDEWLEKAEKFVDKMFSLLNALEVRKKEKILERTHEVMIKAAATALSSVHKFKLPKESEVDVKEIIATTEKNVKMPLAEAFKKDFIDTKKVGNYYWDVWNKINSMKKLADEKKITELQDKDVYQMREYVRKLIHDLAKILKTEEISEEKE